VFADSAQGADSAVSLLRQLSGQRYPEWGGGRLEVVADDQVDTFSEWNVEEHAVRGEQLGRPTHSLDAWALA
jgi:dolichyl-phosphate-mannose--protein O-mannosyl transferase